MFHGSKLSHLCYLNTEHLVGCLHYQGTINLKFILLKKDQSVLESQ